MDHPSDEKTVPSTIEDAEIENLDESLVPKNETLASGKAAEFKEVQSDDEKTLEDQKNDSVKEKQFSTQSMDIQTFSTDAQTEKQIRTEMESVGNENIKDAETKITEERGTRTEPEKTMKLILTKNNDGYEISNESIKESMEDNRKKVTETICTADSTTDANPIIIDLCDNDQIEIYGQTDSKNVVSRNINLKSSKECDVINKATPEQMEDNTENVTTTDSNKQIRDTIIIDLCGDDQTEMYEKNVCNVQEVGGGTLSRNEGRDISSLVIKLKEGRGITGSIHKTESLCDNSGTETENISTIENKDLKVCELTDENVSEEARELTNIEELKSFQMKETDVSGTFETTLKSHAKDVDPDNSNVLKDDKLTVIGDDGGCIETESVSTKEECGALPIKVHTDEIEIKPKAEEYQIETFRFKDDIITLQEDYGMDTKPISNESSYNLEKAEMVSEDAKFTILDESDSEGRQYGASDLILGCGHKDATETSTKIRDIVQSVAKSGDEVTGSKLKREETEIRENIDHEPDLKLGKNEKEEIQLILIKKEIEDNLKHFDGKGTKEHTPSTVEKIENNRIHGKATEELDQSDSIRVPSTSESFYFPNQVMEGRLSENINHLTVTAQSMEPSSGGEVDSCSKNLQLIINLDIVNSAETEDIATSKPNGMKNGCAIGGSHSKVSQADKGENPNKNLANASAYLNDTPTSLSDSESNEEFYDAVEYIPEGCASKELSLKIKPSTALLSTPSLNLMKEPIPGPSGISIKKTKDETQVIKPEEEKDDYQEANEFSSDEDTKFSKVEKKMANEKSLPIDDILKMKESRKHDDMEDDDENENQKKIRLY